MALHGTADVEYPAEFSPNFCQTSDASVGVPCMGLGHCLESASFIRMCISVLLKPEAVKVYVISLLIYNLVTLLSKFIKSFP